ncbi:MAG: translation elongation factor Ts [Malacoplasma sp.]
MSVATPQKVKELRERTQAGFMDCQKALIENNGDIDKSIEWLREKGIAKAAKKADAIAAEGVTKILVSGDSCLILEVNTQTDFVAKNKEFQDLVNLISESILKNKKTSKEDVEAMIVANGKDVKTLCLEATGKIGEKINFRRAEILSKNKDQTFGVYQHSNDRVSSIVLIEGIVDTNVAKDVAMHVTAMNPKFINKNEIDKNWLETERKILIEKTIQEGKPKEFAEKIVVGRLDKTIAEVCLEEQAFIKDPNIKVGTYLSTNGGKISKMIRYELGEGIEKANTDFVSEVTSQMKR